MKKITKWVTKQGLEFDDPQRAKVAERLLEAVDDLFTLADDDLDDGILDTLDSEIAADDADEPPVLGMTPSAAWLSQTMREYGVGVRELARRVGCSPSTVHAAKTDGAVSNDMWAKLVRALEEKSEK